MRKSQKFIFEKKYQEVINNSKQSSPFIEHTNAKGLNTSISLKKFLNRVEHHKKIIKGSKKNCIIISGNSNPEFLASVLATLLLKKTAFPLSPQYNNSTIKNICIDNNLSADLYRNEVLTSCSNHHNDPDFSNENDFIYILTSGTTGTSKVVRQKQSSVLDNINNMISIHSLNRKKIILTPLPCFHVNALEFSFFCSLFSGSTLILLEKINPEHILEKIKKFSPDIISIEPNILRQISKYQMDHNTINMHQNSYFVTAASALSINTYLSAREAFKVKIIQGYGLSEAINFSCIMPPTTDIKLLDKYMTENKRTSIGPAITPGTVHVLDENLSPVLEGTEGQIFLSGNLLMTGYLNTQPINQKEKLLATGDIGFYINNADNIPYFYISGRIKEIIKKNSITIPLIEMDEILSSLIDIYEDVISAPFNHSITGENYAIIFNDKIGFKKINDIKNKLSKTLPDFKLPGIYAVTSENLRTESGKPARSKFREYLNKNYTNHIIPIQGIVITEKIHLNTI